MALTGGVLQRGVASLGRALSLVRVNSCATVTRSATGESSLRCKTPWSTLSSLSLALRAGHYHHSSLATKTRSLCSEVAASAGAKGAEKTNAFGAVLPTLLGAAGLIPFVALTPQGTELIGALANDSLPALKEVPGFTCLLAKASELQLSYAATIISFLGGVHWGTAMTSAVGSSAVNLRFLWGVTPSLLAWASLSLPPVTSHGALIASLVSCYVVDLHFYRQKLLQPWYFSLRLPLTVIASSSLGLSLYTAWSRKNKIEKDSVNV